MVIKVGPIIRIAPNELAIGDPESIKTIYSVKTGFTKVVTTLPTLDILHWLTHGEDRPISTPLLDPRSVRTELGNRLSYKS